MPAVAFYHRAGQKAGPVGTARAGETALVFVAPGLPRFARNDGGQTSPVIASLTSALPTRVDETALVFVAPGLPRFARNDGESSAQTSLPVIARRTCAAAIQSFSAECQEGADFGSMLWTLLFRRPCALEI